MGRAASEEERSRMSEREKKTQMRAYVPHDRRSHQLLYPNRLDPTCFSLARHASGTLTTRSRTTCQGRIMQCPPDVLRPRTTTSSLRFSPPHHVFAPTMQNLLGSLLYVRTNVLCTNFFFSLHRGRNDEHACVGKQCQKLKMVVKVTSFVRKTRFRIIWIIFCANLQ